MPALSSLVLCSSPAGFPCDKSRSSDCLRNASSVTLRYRLVGWKYCGIAKAKTSHSSMPADMKASTTFQWDQVDADASYQCFTATKTHTTVKCARLCSSFIACEMQEIRFILWQQGIPEDTMKSILLRVV